MDSIVIPEKNPAKPFNPKSVTKSDPSDAIDEAVDDHVADFHEP